MADWFRWWHGTVTDPKFMWVSRRSGRPLSEVLAVWAALLETASNGETRGNVSCFDSVSHDCLLGFEDGICDRIVAAMTDKGMVDADGNLTGWERRQPKREDLPSAESRAKSSTERVRAYRDRMKLQRGETDETAMKRSETQETAREEESRQEGKPPTSPIGEVSPPSDETPSVTETPEASPEAPPQPEGAKASLTALPAKPTDAQKGDARGTRLPADWRLPKAWGDWALAEAIKRGAILTPDDVRETAEKFRDFWVAKPGKDGRKAEWEATWRNWIRREFDRQPAATPRRSIHDQRSATIAALTGQSGGSDDILEGQLRVVG